VKITCPPLRGEFCFAYAVHIRRGKPGQWKESAGYIRDRVPAFALLLSHFDDSLAAAVLGFLSLGLPVINNLGIPALPKIDTTLFEAIVSEKITVRCLPGVY